MEELKKSEDYSIFKIRQDNREIDPAHVNRLAQSIEKTNDLHLNPLIVTSTMEVVDGQHRLEAAKKLGVPVYYLVDDNYHPEKMITLNTTQKKWVSEDYLNYWCQHDKIDYIKLKSFKEDMGYPLSVVLIWLGGPDRGRSAIAFRSGTYRFNAPEELVNAMYSTQHLIDELKEMSVGPKRIFIGRPFHEACKRFFLNPLVDKERFFERLNVFTKRLHHAFSWQEYFEQFVEIYNYSMKTNRVRLIQDGTKRELVA